MKMTVKKKVLAGAISVGLLSGVGMAFANTDAGGALKTWYDGKFNSALVTINKDVEAYAKKLRPGLEDEYNEMLADAEDTINDERDTKINGVKGVISAAKDSHVESVENTKAKILADIDYNFDKEFQKGWLKIQEAGTYAIDAARSDMARFTDQKGQDALAQVSSELTTAKDSAVKELEEAISKAKGELALALAYQQGINTRELKKTIDFKIVDVRNEVEAILEGLVKKQTDLIASQAADLQAKAIAALDEVVSSINK